jgi:hypothetical protein
MTQPPMQQQLIQDLQTIEKQEAEAAAREQQMEMAKAQGGKASLSAVK